VKPECEQIPVIAEVEELLAFAWPTSRQKVGLIVTVQMNFEGLGTGLITIEKFFSDARSASRRYQSREPVFTGNDVGDNRPRLYDTGPANDGRHTPAALPIGVLFATEWRSRRIGPQANHRSVVGGVNENGVGRQTRIIEIFQNLANLRIVLDHAIGILTEPGCTMFRPDVREIVHAGSVEPHEEWLLRAFRAVHEVKSGRQELCVDSFHALLGKRSG